MSWKKITLDSSAVTAGAASKLQDDFTTIFVAAKAPLAAAMYGSLRHNKGKLHYFFSPAAVRLASALLDAHSAVDCPQPDIRNLAVLVKNSGWGPAG
jgi:hypothetical protein